MKHTFSVGGYAAYSLAVVYMISRDSVMILVGTCQCQKLPLPTCPQESSTCVALLPKGFAADLMGL